MNDSSKIRKDFPFLSSYDYWESTAVGPTMQKVIDSMVEYYQKTPFNYGVGTCEQAIMVLNKVDEARTYIAKLIGASKEEITVYPKNTSEALGMVIDGLEWKEDDEIIGCNTDHLATYLPSIRLMKEKGVRFRMIKADKDGFVSPSEFKKRINSNTKLVVICHASNIYGSILNAKEICKLSKEAGALTLVDAAQTIARMPVDVNDLGCDFLAMCGRKHLCGPQGSAALYIKKDIMDKLNTIFVAGGAAKLVKDNDFDYEFLPGVDRFNAGILNTSGVIGLGVAVKYWMDIGIEEIRDYIIKLSKEIFEELKKLNAAIYSPQDISRQVGIISFRLPNVHPDVVADTLEKKYKIILRSGSPGSPVFKELGVDKINRISPHYYTGADDMNRLFSALHEVSK